MQRPPLFESDSFIYWKNIFETYVKSKDLDLWHVITNGDFQPIEQNLETKLDETRKKSSDEDCLTSGCRRRRICHVEKRLQKFLKRRVDLCGNPNHLIGECPKESKDENQIAFVGGSWSDSGEEDDEKVNNETCLVAQASSEICLGVDLEPDEWIKDSESSKHMTGNRKLFSSYKAYNEGQICDNKCRVTFSEHDSEITKDGKVIGRGIRKKGLYVMKLGNKPKDKICLATIDENSTLWHRRLGHANIRLIESLASKELVRNLPKLKFEQHFCDACKIGKQSHASHKAKNIVSTTRWLELLHMDLFDPSTKQTTLPTSTTEAEYVSAGKACKQALWMKQALIDYDVRLNDVPIMWSLDELAYGVPKDGPYQTHHPSPYDIISYIQNDREGQVTRIHHEEEIEVQDYQILTCEIVSTLKPLEEIMWENVFCLEGNRDHFVTEQARLILPYGMLLTRLFKYVMQENPEFYKSSYVLYDRVMNPLTAQQERKTRKDRGTRRGRHSTSSSTFDQPSSSHLNYDDDDDGNDEGTSRASTPSPTRFVNSLTNDVPQVFQNPPNIDPDMEPFYTRQTKIINRQV
ncbi:retrovirus-related pol polyprotein from transposon TNT 1-94 [Tanacetum coccineum]